MSVQPVLPPLPATADTMAWLRALVGDSAAPLALVSDGARREFEVLLASPGLAELAGVPAGHVGTVTVLPGAPEQHGDGPTEVDLREPSRTPQDRPGQLSGNRRRRHVQLGGSPARLLWVSRHTTGTGVDLLQFALPHEPDGVPDLPARGQHQVDPVTGLKTRTTFERLGRTAIRGCSTEHPVAVLAIDLDRFKLINDHWGHDAGDVLLRAIAERLVQAHPAWQVTRIGGDEFIITIDDVGSAQLAHNAAQHALAAVSDTSIVHQGTVLMTTASIGVCMVTKPDTELSEAVRHADTALYSAKAAGRGRYVIGDTALVAGSDARLAAERRLRDALARRSVDVHFQPIVDLSTSRVIAYEALARLRDNQGQLITPDGFIAVAEESGLVYELDIQVWNAVLQRAIGAPRLSGPGVRIAVNVSGRTLSAADFTQHVRTGLDRASLPGEKFIVEITEHSALENSPRVQNTLIELTSLGIHLAIDDFGTGYSGLAHLRRLPVQHLKVDRMFVAQLKGDPGATSTVKAIIEIAHAHGLAVIAEGVESAGDARSLHELGCNAAQGWLFGAPAPLDPLNPRYR